MVPFLKEKKEIGTKVVSLIKDLQLNEKLQVKWVRCNNSGENQNIQKELTTNNLEDKNGAYGAKHPPENWHGG